MVTGDAAADSAAANSAAANGVIAESVVTGGGLPAAESLRAVFFDLDDTLVDARHSWQAGFCDAIRPLLGQAAGLRRLGEPQEIYRTYFRRYSDEAYAAVGGEWSRDFSRTAFRRLLAEHDEPDDALADRLLEAYVEAWPRHIETFEDVMETLELVRSRYRVALITNGRSVEQRLKIERGGLADAFDVIVVSGEVGVRKPDPAIFGYALRALDVEPGHAMHIGDSAPHDVRGARNAGLGAVWVDRGHGQPEDERSEPHVRVTAIGELCGLLGLEASGDSSSRGA